MANILIADDVVTQRMAIEIALGELGEEVVSVESGRDALKFLLDHDAAVILLDVNMPGMDGFETAALIRQRPRTANTPIIFLTADTDEVQALRGYALGAVDYLFCPFLPEVLRTKVKVFVELSRTQERIRREAEQRVALSREQAARAAAEEQSRRLRFVAEASGVLTRSLDGAPFVDALLELFVPLVADVAVLTLSAAGDVPGGSTWVGGLAANGRRSHLAGPHPELERALSRAIASAELVTLPGPDGRGVAGLALPLSVHDTFYGALGVAMTDSGRDYNADLVEIIKLVASRTAIALDNLKLHGELHERDRRKDEFLAMLSHELRNPLGAISTAVHLLELTGSNDERATHARGVISRQSLHLTRIIDDLLEVSRVTAGQIAVVRGPVRLRDVVDRAVETLRASGRLHQHRVLVRGGEGVLVNADSARMEQVVTNLLVNSLKYTDAGGEVTLEVGSEADDGIVRLTDTGIGISPELLPRIFDVFVQGQQALDRAEGGLGLGLALVRKLVELQGGSVSAASEGKGCGSTFEVRLPKLPQSEPAGAEDPLPGSPATRMRVLLVEDHADVRETLRLLLELQGHEVHEADSGPKSVEVAAQVRPQLAFVDLGLPGFDGFEVARRLRDRLGTHGLTLVALTGYGQAEDRARTRMAGFDAHMVKPVSRPDLVRILEIASRRATGIEVEARPPEPVAESSVETSPET